MSAVIRRHWCRIDISPLPEQMMTNVHDYISIHKVLNQQLFSTMGRSRRGVELLWHYTDVIITTMASQITSLTMVYPTVYSDADQKKTSKLRVTGLCVGNSPVPMNSLHKGPVTQKMFPFDDVIMIPCITLRIPIEHMGNIQQCMKPVNSVRTRSILLLVSDGIFLSSYDKNKNTFIYHQSSSKR